MVSYKYNIGTLDTREEEEDKDEDEEECNDSDVVRVLPKNVNNGLEVCSSVQLRITRRRVFYVVSLFVLLLLFIILY